MIPFGKRNDPAYEDGYWYDPEGNLRNEDGEIVEEVEPDYGEGASV